MITLIVWLVWLTGVLYFAPKYAARDAAMRGLIRVDGPAMFMGFAKSAIWWFAWTYPYVEKRANIELAKFPDVKYKRALAAGRVSDEMERELQTGDTAT